MVSLGSQDWKRARAAAIERDGRRCRRCGRPGALEVHHRTPRQVDGSAENVLGLEGLETLCRNCHIEHHRRPRTAAEDAWADLVDELTR